MAFRDRWETEFQSAPLTEARGDSYLVSDEGISASVSIRSPHRSKGRHVAMGHISSENVSFNPLPSPKQGETGDKVKSPDTRMRFQSAPLTEARGDAFWGILVVPPFVVSIRSPHRSKGRHPI